MSGTQYKTADLPVLKGEKPVRRTSLEAWLLREERNEGKAERTEFFNGTINRLPMARGPHNLICGNIITSLNNAIDQLDKPFFVFSSQQKVFSPALNAVFYPDALTVAETPEYWDAGEQLLLNPLLIVEVGSPSTEGYDRSGKFQKYSTIPSFQEYLLVRQDKIEVESWFQQEADVWRKTVVSALDEAILLRSMGVSIPLKAIYKRIQF